MRVNKSAVVLVIDSLELRRAGVVSFLAPWAVHNHIKIVQVDPGDAMALSSACPIKMILLVIGAHGVEEPEPQNWMASLSGKYAGIPLVLVSEREESEEVVAAFRAGARGFIPMSVTPPMAMQAFTFIMSGGSFFPPDRSHTKHACREFCESYCCEGNRSIRRRARPDGTSTGSAAATGPGESEQINWAATQVARVDCQSTYSADHAKTRRYKSNAGRALRCKVAIVDT